MAEETIYVDNNVSVTTARVIIFGTTYALRNITSVKMTTTPPSNGCAVTLIVVGALALLSAVPAFAEKVFAGLTSLIIGGMMIAAGIVWAQFQKPS